MMIRTSVEGRIRGKGSSSSTIRIAMTIPCRCLQQQGIKEAIHIIISIIVMVDGQGRSMARWWFKVGQEGVIAPTRRTTGRTGVRPVTVLGQEPTPMGSGIVMVIVGMSRRAASRRWWW